ncbi:hypothetical protein HQ45_04155 [Porphyromonas crevioricanis]|uniref:Uncharacterized protein n=1 Tax=Porphyromonas crevioricanis JCM 15906 TaxID=1305617 RepID=S4NFS4_9PORP|nr:outer membrane beta-barrel protein [Porphyromonas crevioricanis]KGN90021.1 hypothetical protein HQ45_04155 [Porphyromonas crevioricanis]GAD04427.1 hypothetical protein PORCRE_111 [Porphyromonas crevioricanis JCM 15906]SJZ68465.1 Outer membrane protein beta-barrel domain-containing protein [Porphyromonas crevioricanis]
MQRRFPYLFLLSFLLIPVGLEAQEYLFEFGGQVGLSQYVGDIGRRAPFSATSYTFSAEGRYNINFRFALSSQIGYYGLKGRYRYADNIFPERKEVDFDSHLYHWGVMGEFNFVPLSDKFSYLRTSRFSPYVGFGGGLALGPSYQGTVVAPSLQIGGGFKYKINSRLGVSVQYIYRWLLSDAFDAPNEQTKHLDNPFRISQTMLRNGDGLGSLTFSFTYSLGTRDKRDCRTEKRKMRKKKIPELKLK